MLIDTMFARDMYQLYEINDDIILHYEWLIRSIYQMTSNNRGRNAVGST